MRCLAFFCLLILTMLVMGGGLLLSFAMPSPATGFPVFLLSIALAVIIVREAERVW
jgi:hypothetical protein